MPVSPTPPDSYFEEIARAYQQAELEILGGIKNRLLKGIQLDDQAWATARLAEIQDMRRQALVKLAEVNNTLRGELNKTLYNAYKDGGLFLLDDAREFLPDVPSAVSSPARMAAVRAIANRTTEALAQRLPNMLRQAEDAYAAVVRETLIRVQAGGVDRRTATGQALQAAYGQGLKMGPNGKMNLPDYVTMAVRTGTANASIEGHLDAMAEVGLDLVYINPGPRHCEICDQWANRVLWRGTGPVGVTEVEDLTTGKMTRVTVEGTLSQAKAAGWGHPNCRCSVGAYIPGATSLPKPRPDWDGEGYAAQQEQRAIERKIREWKTKSALATTPEDVRAANGKVAEWQKAQRDHMRDNPYLKRQSAREQVSRVSPRPAENAETTSTLSTTETRPRGFRGPSDAEKLRNAEVMFGTDSPQYREAQRRFGTAAPATTPAPTARPPRSQSVEDLRKRVDTEFSQFKVSDGSEFSAVADTNENVRLFKRYTTNEGYGWNQELRYRAGTPRPGLDNTPAVSINRYLKGADALTDKIKALPPSAADARTARYSRVRPNDMFPDIPKDASMEDVADALVGREYTENGFLSTAHGKDGEFNSTPTDTPVYFEFLVPKGTKAANVDGISQNQGEQEILFPPGTKFTIVDATTTQYNLSRLLGNRVEDRTGLRIVVLVDPESTQ